MPMCAFVIRFFFLVVAMEANDRSYYVLTILKLFLRPISIKSRKKKSVFLLAPLSVCVSNPQSNYIQKENPQKEAERSAIKNEGQC